MKTKKLAAWFLSLAMALSLAACGGDSQTSGGETGDSTTADTSGGDAIVLRASHSCAISHPYQLGLEKFAELVDEKTNGAVQIDIFHSAQLGDERANIEDLQMGTLDIAVSSTGPLGNFVSDYLILDLPFLFTSYEHAHAVLDGEIGQNLMAKLDDIGIVGGAFWENGFREMTNSKHPINSVADCAGLKIRCMENQVHMDAFSALGMDPTPMAWSEVFTALQQGVIDAAENSELVYRDFKNYEVAPYYAYTRHIVHPDVVLASTDFLNSMSDGDRAIFDQLIKESTEKEFTLFKEAIEQAKKDTEAAGAQFCYPDTEELRERCMPLLQRIAEQSDVTKKIYADVTALREGEQS